MDLSECIAILQADKKLNNRPLIKIFKAIEKSFSGCLFSVKRDTGSGHWRNIYAIQISKIFKSFIFWGSSEEKRIAEINFSTYTNGERRYTPLPTSITIYVHHKSAEKMASQFSILMEAQNQRLQKKYNHSLIKVEKHSSYSQLSPAFQ